MPSQFTQQIVQSPPAFDFVAAHFQCEANRYSPSNSDGFVNFGSAQNCLHENALSDHLELLTAQTGDFHYQSFNGTETCRASIADYLTSQGSVPITPDTIVVGKGVISILEALTISLLDEGDSVLIPTPVFPGLVNAMSTRVRSRVQWMHTDARDGFRITPAAVEANLHRLCAEGQRVRAILICSPGNPVGQVFSRRDLDELHEIAEMFDCALIVDEIYAGSVLTNHRFVSATSLKSQNVYVLGGLSKDFGLAGYATGWLQTTNANVVKSVAKQSHFFRLPAPIQNVLSRVLDPKWRDDYLHSHRRELTRVEQFTRSRLQKIGIDVTESEAGLCLWIDLRRHLRRESLPGEMELYQYLLNQHRVHISPGTGFKTQDAGFFRICFSQPSELLIEGLNRIQQGLVCWDRMNDGSGRQRKQFRNNVRTVVLNPSNYQKRTSKSAAMA